jgi:hypothetical protein
MARPLIVEPDTRRLQVALMHGDEAVDAAAVTLTVTRKGKVDGPPVSDCADACAPPYPCPHDVVQGRGCCLGGCRTPAACPSQSKTYIAESVVRGIATFAIDHDLIDAPEGWYLGYVAVDGCEVAVLTIWVRCGRGAARALDRPCQGGEGRVRGGLLPAQSGRT